MKAYDALALLAETPRSDQVKEGLRRGLGRPKLHNHAIKFLCGGKHGGRVYGTKAWCSKGRHGDSALMTGLDAGMSNRSSWRCSCAKPWAPHCKLQAAGMPVGCRPLKVPQSFLNGVFLQSRVVSSRRVWRPSRFWQARCGIAAVWYGATVSHR